MSRHRKVLLFLALAGLVFAYDSTRPPEKQWTAAALVTGIELYQGMLSVPLGAAGVSCRFEPTCSHYAVAVIRRDGAVKGGWRTLRRLARCGPWTAPGTADPP